MERLRRAIALLTACLVFAACSGGRDSGSDAASDGAPAADDAHTLQIIAGSELKDLQPWFGRIAAATGISIVPTYAGTLAGVDRLNAGERFDAAWFASDKYLLLSPTRRRVRESARIMLSPVVIGVKRSVAARFGWTSETPWKAIAARAGAGEFHFAMTNPAASNSGFSAVIAVASALAHAQDALRPSDVDTAKLRSFFAGQTLTAGSSGWLVDAYVRDQDRLDGIVNYEAALLALDAGGQLHEPLTLIYPKEGVVTADYPMLLLNEDKRAAFDKVTAYLRSPDMQRLIMEKTYRRPVSADVALAPSFPHALVNEVAFPRSLDAVNGILERFLADERVPAHTYYVLDTSGSMEGPRLEGVVAALDTLAGSDRSVTGHFARFENRERISLISFSDRARPPVDLQMRSADDAATRQTVRAYASELHAGGSTAIYCALETALDDAARSAGRDGPRYASIVLMTDGENNRCDDEATFVEKYRALPAAARIRIFPILFGEGSSDELERIATISGGRLFNGIDTSLSEVFKEIRGYQ